MARVTFHLALVPVAGDEFRYVLSLGRLVDDGAKRRLDPVRPPDGESSELTIDPTWLGTMAGVRTNPGAVKSVAKVRDIGRALWEALPAFARRALSLPLRDDEVIRVVLQATGRVLELPWEFLCLGDWSAEQAAIVDRAPFLRGQGELVRRPVDVAPVERRTEALRRALLVVGSLDQPPDKQHAGDDAASIARAIGRAGFEVVIAAGRRDLDAAHGGGLRVDEALDDPAALSRLIRTGGFTLLHYVGHSGAESGADPMGARAITLEIGGFTQDLALGELASACRDGHLRCAVFSACDLRAHAADELLCIGGLEHVLTMGAMVPVTVCSRWSAGFYESLRNEHAVSLAASAGARRLAETDFAKLLSWLPQHYERDDVDLSFADDDRVLLERYCTALCARLDAMEGRFRKRLDPARLADVYVELTVDERSADRKDDALDARDRRLPDNCTFAALTGLHTRRFLLGGKPGAGKSTTLRVHARALASDPQRKQVPIFVSLAEWLASPKQEGGFERLIDFVARRHAPSATEKGRLTEVLTARGRNGALLVLLDGLDELPQPARTYLDEELERLAHAPDVHPEWARSRFVVSTRRYEHTIRIRGFADVDIQELKPPRAAELLGHVLRTQAAWKDRAETVARAWEQNFAQGPRAWQELGKVPLFVTLIGELLIHGREVGRSRAAFFDEVFDHLCLDQHHGPALDPQKGEAGVRPLISGDTKKERRARIAAVLDLLGHLALRMTQNSRVTATRGELLDWLEEKEIAASTLLSSAGLPDDAEDLLDTIARKTLILAPDTDREIEKHEQERAPWRFWHRSFQEALAGRALARALKSTADVPGMLGRMRMEPSGDEVASEHARLLAKWRKDTETFSDEFREAGVAATPEQWASIQAHFDQSTRRWNPTVIDAVADVFAPISARRAQQDFWIEPAALAVGRVLELDRALGLALTSGLIGKDRDLGRRTVERIEHCPPPILELGLEASSRSDQQVRAAQSENELYEGLTLRLSDRAPLYAIAAASTTDPTGLAALLQHRLSEVDDPGELFLIDETLRALGETGRAARAAVLARCGRFDAALFADHFVQLGGGRFRMGSDSGNEREKPVHDVDVSPFAIGRTPITVAMYRAFWPEHRMEIGSGLQRLGDWRGKFDGSAEGVDRLPVTYVSWFAARMFCRWLDQHRRDLPGWKETWSVALPREAEAEFAIRGGLSSEWFCAEGALAEHAWFHPQAGGRPHAVAGKHANPFGLFDVHGNIWEWCEDSYAPYPLRSGRRVDPIVLGSCASSRVLRGGSFVNDPDLCRSAYRNWNHPAVSYGSSGFRVVLALRSPGSEWAIEDRQSGIGATSGSL